MSASSSPSFHGTPTSPIGMITLAGDKNGNYNGATNVASTSTIPHPERASYKLKHSSSSSNGSNKSLRKHSSFPPLTKQEFNFHQLNAEHHVQNDILPKKHRITLIFVRILGILTLGILDVALKNWEISLIVDSLRIGNRKIVYNSTDGHRVKITYMWNLLLSILTCGIWYFMGVMHTHFYSVIDMRLSWGEVDRPRKILLKHSKADIFPVPLNEFVVWQPHPHDYKGELRIFNIHMGFKNELIYFLLKLLSILTLGITSPFADYFWMYHSLGKMYLGKGRFMVLPPTLAQPLLKQNTSRNSCNNTSVQDESSQEPTPIYKCDYPVLGQDVIRSNSNSDPSGATKTSNDSYLPLYEMKLGFSGSLAKLFYKHCVVNCFTLATCGISFFFCLNSHLLNGYYNKKCAVQLVSLS
ncbi:hypothetical protein C9374_013641 [Naegleria lovaniensis]|uniref:Uncharacterized protein n=1 Tax=Naegleria lovaniensis TaxID=51637 RepID=A0AA88G9K1_NAELO|nr:uncharacterized protein C9374_013641 [Naegleria lovaniensis]KAG2372686.1 hypothetical protein C9374_013641 [Naegleria lovaniensis]